MRVAEEDRHSVVHDAADGQSLDVAGPGDDVTAGRLPAGRGRPATVNRSVATVTYQAPPHRCRLSEQGREGSSPRLRAAPWPRSHTLNGRSLAASAAIVHRLRRDGCLKSYQFEARVASHRTFAKNRPSLFRASCAALACEWRTASGL